MPYFCCYLKASAFKNHAPHILRSVIWYTPVANKKARSDGMLEHKYTTNVKRLWLDIFHLLVNKIWIVQWYLQEVLFFFMITIECPENKNEEGFSQNKFSVPRLLGYIVDYGQ